jgi:maleylpyruvate isomerase
VTAPPSAEHQAAFPSGLDEVAHCTDRLLASLDLMNDADLRVPSLLPAWTRAHVLTHLARNADGLANLARWARTGEETPMYAGGREGRDAEIEAGADRQIGDIRLDLNDSAERLLEAFADFPDDAFGREVRFTSGSTCYGWELPLMRVREVEIHHVDLETGYTPAHWPPTFVVRTLDQLAPMFRTEREMPAAVLSATDSGREWQVAETGPTLSGPQSALLAWAIGRSSGDGLELDAGADIPLAPVWS